MAGNQDTHTAAGYGDSNIASIFAQQKIAVNFINDNCRIEAPWTDIAMSEYMGDLCPGDIVKFVVVDGAFEFRPHDYNGTRRYQTIGDANTICAQLCAPTELAIKRNLLLNCGSREEMMSRIVDEKMRNTLHNLNNQYYQHVINLMLSGAAAANKGNTAGAKTGSIPLGTIGSPLPINLTGTAEQIRKQVVDIFGRLIDANDEQDNEGCNGDKKFIMPKTILNQFRSLENGEQCCDFSKSILVNGVNVFTSLMGHAAHAVPTTALPLIPQANGFIAPVLYISTNATAFTGGITHSSKDMEHEDETIVLLETRGGVVVRPRHISVAWVRVIR